MKSPEKVIIINHGLPEFIAKQLVFFGLIVGVIGIGIWLESSVLQYVGAALWIIAICIKAYQLGQNDPRSMTLDEAAAQIEQWQKEQAEEDIAARKTANQPTPGVTPKDAPPPQKPRR